MRKMFDIARRNRSGVILILVLVTILVVLILANVILSIISNQSRLTHHQATRIGAYYAGQAIMNYTLEKLRVGDWSANPSGGADKYACFASKGCIDTGFTSDYNITDDAGIPYKVQVTIKPANANGIVQLNIKTDFTYP